MKKFVKVILATVMTLLVAVTASAANQTISVDFQGRSSDTGNPGTVPLAPTDIAGVVAVGNWNAVDNQYNVDATIQDFTANNGTTGPLKDDTGAVTTATLTFVANDSWYNDVPIADTTTPNTVMMNGIIKRQGAGTSAVFTFNNLADAQYDVYVYLTMNGDGVRTDISDLNFTKTFYVVEQHQFTTNSTFIQAVNTNPAGPFDTGNYVLFTNLATYGGSSIGIQAKYISGADGNGIAGLQIVKVGPPITTLPPPVVLTQPVGGRFLVGQAATLTAGIAGPNVSAQWFKGAAPILDATNFTYTTPPLVAGDNGAAFHLVATNTAGSVTTADATIAIGALVPSSGFITSQRYNGAIVTDVEDPTFDRSTWNNIYFYPSFETASSSIGDNYTEAVSALFTAPLSGNYVFFITSDDDSNLWLSTDATPANKRMIAQQEPNSWNNYREWTSVPDLGNGNLGDVLLKRSDTAAFTPQPITLVGGNKYYIEAVHHQGGGGVNLGVSYALEGEAGPANGSATALLGGLLESSVLDIGTVTITTQPVSASAQESRKATFTVAATSAPTAGVTTAPPIYYQWQRAASNSAVYLPIRNAISSTYTTPKLTLANDNGAKYRCLVMVQGQTATSAVATLTVTPDTTPPTAEAGAIQRNGAIQVGVTFDETVDRTTLTTGNITLQGGTIASLTIITNHGGTINGPGNVTDALLETTGLTAGGSYTVTVAGVKDVLGNAMASTVIPFKVPDTQWASVGASLIPGKVVPVGDDGYDVISGGSGFWANYDEITLVYVKKTNDFDVKVQVVDQDFSSRWGRGGLQVRENTDDGHVRDDGDPTDPATYLFSAYKEVHANNNQNDTPSSIDPAVDNGQGTAVNNSWEANQRVGYKYGAVDNNTTGWGGGGPAPAYPDAWLRLQRTGTNFFGFRSLDGNNWTQIATATWDAPAVLLVGPGYGPENGNSWTDPNLYVPYMIQYRNFGDNAAAAPIITSIQITAGNVVINWSNGGALESATSATGPWTTTGNSSGSYSAPVGAGNSYFRVNR